MELSTLQAFEAEITKNLPTFKIAYKDQTWWMKVINFFSAPFNPTFMTEFITTFGNTVYFPNQAFLESQVDSSFIVLAHEFVHMMDSKKYPVLYQLSYALPQALAPIALLVFMILGHMGWLPVLILAAGVTLACWAAQKSLTWFFVVAGAAFVLAATLAIFFSHWWAAMLFGGLLLLAPLPSPGRTHWEMRGYTMTLAVQVWAYKSPTTAVQDTIAEYFFGPDYFFMSWTKKNIYADITAAIESARIGTLIQAGNPYSIVYDFLVAQKLLLPSS